MFENKPEISLQSLPQSTSFDDLLEAFIRLNEREPPIYNSYKRSPMLYKSRLHHYIGMIPGAFRPPMIPKGLWQRDGTLYSKYDNIAMICKSITCEGSVSVVSFSWESRKSQPRNHPAGSS